MEARSRQLIRIDHFRGDTYTAEQRKHTATL
jgi:hypothetical protein